MLEADNGTRRATELRNRYFDFLHDNECDDTSIILKRLKKIIKEIDYLIQPVNYPFPTKDEEPVTFQKTDLSILGMTQLKDLKREITKHYKELEIQELKEDKIIWFGTIADLARLFRALKDMNLIVTTEKAFSNHFVDKNGKPVPNKLTSNLKGDDYSPNQKVLNVQHMINKMDRGNSD
jgi:hypothetical protein